MTAHRAVSRRGADRETTPRLARSIAVTALSLSLLTAVVYYMAPSSSAQVASRRGSSSNQHSLTKQTSPVRWTTIYQDNFNGKAGSPPGPAWEPYQGTGFGIGQFLATPQVVHLDGKGDLVVTAERSGSDWFSGEIELKRGFMPSSGHTLMVESRIELPAGGQGYWPAFWGLGVPAATQPQLQPTAGEVDIVETIDNRRWLGQWLHCGVSEIAGPCGSKTLAIHRLTVPSGASGWHVYSWMWFNEGSNPYVAFYIDQKLQLEASERSVGKTYWEKAFDHPYYFIYDLAVGGGWAGSPNNLTAAYSSMRVDYIRILGS